MDLDALIAPLAGESPCGEDLSLSAETDAIQELRREDDPTLDQGEWVTDLKVADWPGVIKSCEKLLRTRTKDLRIAGWLVDAQARVNGFGGLAEGLNLVAALVEQYWDTVHPLAEDGDQEERIGNLTWLSGRVRDLSRQVSLVPLGGKKGLSLVDLEGARARRLAGDAPNTGLTENRSNDEPPLTLEAAWKALNTAGLSVYQAQCEHIDASLAALQRLQTAVDERLGMDGPAFSTSRDALSTALDALKRLAREAGMTLDTEDAGAAEDASAAPADAASGPVAVVGRLQTRAQALEQLRQVADFFRRTEPHSPVAYLADKAARWGNMPLHDWLRAVVKDGGMLAQLDEMLGVERPENPQG